MVTTINGIIGLDVAAAPSTTPQWTVGMRSEQSDGTTWQYLAIPTSTAIRQYDAVGVVAANGTVNALTSTNALTGVAILRMKCCNVFMARHGLMMPN